MSVVLDIYHWRELPQVLFLLRQKYTCLSRQNTSFVVTKVCLLWQKFCFGKHIFVMTNSFVMTKVLSRQAYFCLNKHMFVVTKHVFGHDKSMLVIYKYLLRQKFCHSKNILSWQTYFCHNKSLSQQAYFCCDKTFVVTKMILVAAPANDSYQGWQTFYRHLQDVLWGIWLFNFNDVFELFLFVWSAQEQHFQSWVICWVTSCLNIAQSFYFLADGSLSTGPVML